MRYYDRPGLLLMCHGDLPDSLYVDPGGRRLFGECMDTCEEMAMEFATSPGSDIFSILNGHIASFLSSGSDGPVEQACLGFRRPGIREAMFRAVSRGSRSIVCVGGAGLMLPGHGASVHLPAAVGQVVADNAGLDVCCARPGINPHVASALIMASVENALDGRGIPPGPSWEMPRIGGDTGVIVVSAAGNAGAPGASSRQSARFVAAVKRLSDYMQTRSKEFPAETTGYMSSVTKDLVASGAFCAVRTGCVDFAAPGVRAAADGLVKAGARQIIAVGVPALMSRHALSWADPSDAIQGLKESFPADLIYVKPDPRSFAGEIAAMLRLKVLEAAATGGKPPDRLR